MDIPADTKAEITGWLDDAGLDAETIFRDLATYVELLTKWQRIQNLVSRETLPNLWQRHIADSLQLLRLDFTMTGHVVDLGSGAGLPAILLAIALKSKSVRFTLIEANGRKCAFLREVIRHCGLEANIVDRRVESLSAEDIEPVDLFTSRAFAPFDKMLEYVAPFWQNETRALFHKGKDFGSERQIGPAQWAFDLVEHPSLIETGSVIIDMRHLRASS